MPVTGIRPVSVAGTASTVVCDTPSMSRYHVLLAASAAKPGNLFSLIVPSPASSGQSGASSSWSHSTLTSCGSIDGAGASATVVVVTSTSAAAGCRMTLCVAARNSANTTGTYRDIHDSHVRTAACRVRSHVAAPASAAAAARLGTHATGSDLVSSMPSGTAEANVRNPCATPWWARGSSLTAASSRTKRATGATRRITPNRTTCRPGKSAEVKTAGLSPYICSMG